MVMYNMVHGTYDIKIMCVHFTQHDTTSWPMCNSNTNWHGFNGTCFVTVLF